MFNINFVDDWIRTADLWYWKQPLYKLSHNQFLTVFFSSFSYYLFRFYLLMMMMTTIIMVIKCFPLSLSLSLELIKRLPLLCTQRNDSSSTFFALI